MELVFIFLFTAIFACLTYRHFEWGIFLLCLLLPTYLIRFSIGPLPSTILEVMILIVLFIGLFLCHLERSRRGVERSAKSTATLLKNNKLLFIGITLFLLGATISILTSTDTRAALGEWKAFYVEPVLLFLLLTTVIQQYSNSTIKPLINKILFGLLLCGLATSFFAIYQHFTGFLVPHAFWANQNTFRVTAWYGFPNAVGLFLAPLFPLAVYLVKKHWDEMKKRIWKNSKFQILDSKFLVFVSCILFLITSPLAIVFAKSTGSLIGLLAGIGTLLLFNKKTRLPTLALGMVGLITIIFMPNNGVRQELLAENRSGQIRLALWKESVEFLKDHPIAGAGLASYSEKITPYHKTVNGEGIEIFHHPHNIFLTMWVNLGLMGLMGFIVILVWFYWTGFRSTRLTIFLLSSMTSLLVTGLVDSPYIKNDLSIFFWLLLALMLLATKETHTANS